MTQRVRVVGTRPYVLWLLVIIAMTLAALLIGGGLLVRRSLTSAQAIASATRAAEQALGACLTGLTIERWEEARQTCATAVAVAPADATAVKAYDDASAGYRLSLYNRGKALVESGRPAEALPLLDALFQIDPLYQDISDLRAQAITMQTPTEVPVPTARVTSVPTIAPSLAAMTEEFAYAHCVDDNCDIYVWDPIEKQPVPITQNPFNDWGAAWSPDGRQLLFESSRTLFRQFYVYDFATAQSHQLTDDTSSPAYADWSPNGEEIVCQQSEIMTDTWQLHILDTGGNPKKQLTTEGTNKTPRWAPTGDRIVFSAARADSNGDGKIDDNDDRHIYVIDADGKNLRQITTDAGVYDFLPYWMPDGTQVVFIRHLGGHGREDQGPGDIFLVNADGGDLRALRPTTDDETVAVPSPRSDKFLIVRNESSRNRIYLATWDGAQFGTLAFLLEGENPAWKPIR